MIFGIVDLTERIEALEKLLAEKAAKEKEEADARNI